MDRKLLRKDKEEWLGKVDTFVTLLSVFDRSL